MSRATEEIIKTSKKKKTTCSHLNSKPTLSGTPVVIIIIPHAGARVNPCHVLHAKKTLLLPPPPLALTARASHAPFTNHGTAHASWQILAQFKMPLFFFIALMPFLFSRVPSFPLFYLFFVKNNLKKLKPKIILFYTYIIIFNRSFPRTSLLFFK